MSANEVLMVFTGKSVKTILKEGGTSSWHVKPSRARQCAYAVCTRNSKISWVQGNEPHGSAFLIGRIREVVQTPPEIDSRGRSDRYLIRFSQYALLNIPNVWKGDRVPTRYMTLSELSIDLEKLKWLSMTQPQVTDSGNAMVTELSIAEAKPLLARKYGVPPESIEITIRG